MTQLEKTETILGLIAIKKSEIMSEFFECEAKSLDLSANKHLELVHKKLDKLNDILDSFYREIYVPDKKYFNLIEEIKN